MGKLFGCFIHGAKLSIEMITSIRRARACDICECAGAVLTLLAIVFSIAFLTAIIITVIA